MSVDWIDIRIDARSNGGRQLAADVREGLTRELKELSPKYFYDARGSELFDRITTLPEYYPMPRRAGDPQPARARDRATRTRASWSSWAPAWRRRPGRCCTRWPAPGSCAATCPSTSTQSVVERCADELAELYPGLAVHGVVGDFERDLGHIPTGERRLFAFLGGTIGNLYPAERDALPARRCAS